MIKQIKSYLVFTSLPYRLLVFLLLPILVIGIQMLMGKELLFVAMILMFYVEVISDRFVFGGIAARNVGFPEYIKASCSGRKVLTRALAGNIIRQFVESAAVLFVSTGILQLNTGEKLIGKTFLQCFIVLFWGELIIISITTAARFFEASQAILILTFLGILGFVPIEIIMLAPSIVLIPLGGLVVAAGMVSIRMIEKRMEESYYDRIN